MFDAIKSWEFYNQSICVVENSPSDFGSKGSEVRKDLDNCFADDYKTLIYKLCQLKNAFSVFNFDILSVIYTLCIFLSCTSEVLLFALNVMQFDNVL